MSMSHGERGAALVTTLMLVTVLAVLALGGTADVVAELAMTRNFALDRAVTAAAASGIDLALASGPYELETSRVLTLTLGVANEHIVTVTTRFVGTSEVPRDFSMGTASSGIVAYHFEIESVATGPRGARAVQLAGFYVIGPRLAELGN